MTGLEKIGIDEGDFNLTEDVEEEDLLE